MFFQNQILPHFSFEFDELIAMTLKFDHYTLDNKKVFLKSVNVFFLVLTSIFKDERRQIRETVALCSKIDFFPPNLKKNRMNLQACAEHHNNCAHKAMTFSVSDRHMILFYFYMNKL